MKESECIYLSEKLAEGGMRRGGGKGGGEMRRIQCSRVISPAITNTMKFANSHHLLLLLIFHYSSDVLPALNEKRIEK